MFLKKLLAQYFLKHFIQKIIKRIILQINFLWSIID